MDRRPEVRRLLAVARLLVVDFEMTCGPGVTPGAQDIIEAGFCLVERGRTVTPAHAVSFRIRPTRSVVTGFCTRLTGITPEAVADAPAFRERVRDIRELIALSGANGWASWGPDKTIVHRQCVGADVANPFEHLPHYDLKPLLTSLVYAASGGTRPQGSSRGIGLERALAELGLDMHGRQHSAGSDALNAARVLERLQATFGATVTA